jgi:hypothetical protein
LVGFVAVAASLLAVWALDDESPAPTFTTHTPGEPSATTAPAPTGDPSAGWERVEAPFGARGADDVAAGGEARVVLAVGRDDAGNVAVGRSSDGRDWEAPTALPINTGLTSPPDLRSSISFAGGQFFVGAAEGFWRSYDGRTWEQLSASRSERVSLTGEVTSHSAGLVAVGQEYSMSSGAGWASSPTASWSADGTSWETVELPLPDPAPEAVDGLPVGAASSVASNGGQLVAVGHRDQTGLIWTSTDGRTWERSDSLAPAASSIADVMWIDDRWLAVGTGADGAPAAWTSIDGAGWSGLEIAIPPAGSGGFTHLAGNHRSLIGLVPPSPDVEPALWVSTDGGSTWTAAAARPEDAEHVVQARGVAITADGWVAVGSDAWVWRGDALAPPVSASAPPITAAPDDVETWPPRGALGQAAPAVPPFEAANDIEQAIVDAVYAAFGGGPYLAGDAERFEGDLEGAFDEATEVYPEHAEGIRAAVYEVTIVSDTEARVVFDIIDDGKLVTATTTGRVVLLDGVWTIAQDTICEMMSRGGLRCP